MVRIPAYPKLVRRPERRRRTSSVDSCTARPTYEALPSYAVRPSLPGEGQPFPVPRATRGRIIAVAGNWARLLPKNAELGGKIVRFLPE